MAHVVKHFREIGHDVRRRAAAGDDIVHARFLRHVLAHHVRHHVHRLDGIERGAAFLRRAGRMARDSVEAELAGLVAVRTVLARVVAIRRVPVQRDVGVFEQARAHDVRLARAALFRRRAIEADRAFDPARGEPLLDRNRRADGARAEKIVAAGVRRVLSFDRRAFGHRSLRQAGKRVEFREDRDDGFTRARRCNEARRHAGHSGFDAEAGVCEFLLQQRRACPFLIAEFGQLPDPERRLVTARCAGIDRLQQEIAIARGELRTTCRQRRNNQQTHKAKTH